MRIGIMGGTFDPIHIGHLIAASEAHRVLALDHVMFIPAGEPWQKADRTLSSSADRLAMVELAVRDDDRFSASDIEVRRDGATYAIDTIDQLRAQQPEDEFFWIVGDDVLVRIPTWREWERFVSSVTVVAVNRAGAENIAFDFDYHRIDIPEVRVSATALRDRFAQGDRCKYLVPDSVADYVTTHGLYQL